MKCIKCGNEIILSARTIRERKRDNKPNLCKKCIRSEVMKSYWSTVPDDKKKSIMNNVQMRRDEYFANLTEEERKKRSEAISIGVSNMSDITKENRSKKLSEHQKKFWNNLTEEEYNHQCELRKNGWKNMDPKKRKEWYDKISLFNKDEERRALNRQKQLENYEKNPERRIKLSIDALNQWNNKSNEEKENYANMMKLWWSDLSNRQYVELQQKIAKGIENSKDKKFTDNKLENDLAMIFDKEKITYIRQFGTVEMYDTNTEWFKIYSKYSRFLGYRKNWDFYLPDYDIYIDVDGPYHTFEGSYDKPSAKHIEYLSKKEMNNFSVIQDYYDIRRLLINKRIIILNYDKNKFKVSNKVIELDMSEVNILLTLLWSLSKS